MQDRPDSGPVGFLEGADEGHGSSEISPLDGRVCTRPSIDDEQLGLDFGERPMRLRAVGDLSLALRLSEGFGRTWRNVERQFS